MRVGPGFFATLGTPRDCRPRLRRARVVRRRAAPTGLSVGHRQRELRPAIFQGPQPGRPPPRPRQPAGHRTDIEIIGVVRDFSYRSLREQTEQVFFPFWTGLDGGTFYLRVRGKPGSAFAVDSRGGRAGRPGAAACRCGRFDDQIDRSLRTERMLATLSSGFGVIALLLSVVGLYGVMSFVVTQRTQEIGVRLALGATRSGALWLVVRDAVIMIGAGTAIALPCAWALGRLVEAQLFGVRAVDGPTIALASWRAGAGRARRRDAARLARRVGQPDGGAAPRMNPRQRFPAALRLSRVTIGFYIARIRLT